MHIPRFRTASSALATMAVVLVAAAPAGAEPNQTPPAKKGCEVQLKGPGAGQSIVYADGYSFSVHAQDNKTHTYTCNDGKWTETVSLTASPRPLGGIAAPIGGTFQVLDSGVGQLDTRTAAVSASASALIPTR